MSDEEDEVTDSPGATRRIAVLGLYNSGSTVLAGMLHRLGVNMGPPFFASSDDAASNNYYEPRDLSSKLRRWWSEPFGIETVPFGARTQYFGRWATQQESLRRGRVGAKHPLLSLCGPDLVAAWGEDTQFVWAFRPLEDSTRGLVRRGWFRGHEEAIQQRLWERLHAFESSHRSVTRIDWSRVMEDPADAVKALASLSGIDATRAQMESAVAFLRR